MPYYYGIICNDRIKILNFIFTEYTVLLWCHWDTVQRIKFSCDCNKRLQQTWNASNYRVKQLHSVRLL